MSGNIFKPIDWQRALWNADGTRPWARIAGAYLLLLVPQAIGIAAGIWAARGDFDIGLQVAVVAVFDVLILCGALFFVPEPKQ